MCGASAPRNVPLSSMTPVGTQMIFFDAQHASILVLDERSCRPASPGSARRCWAGRSRSPAPVPRRNGSAPGFAGSRPIRPRSSSRARCASRFHLRGSSAPRCTGPARASSTGTSMMDGDRTVEGLVERAELAVWLFVPPHVEIPVVDAQPAPSGLRVNCGPMSRAQMSPCSMWKKWTWSRGTRSRPVRISGRPPRRQRPARRG